MPDKRKASATSMRRHLTIAALWALLLALLTPVACLMVPAATPAPNIVAILNTPVGISDQATLAALQTQEQNNTDYFVDIDREKFNKRVAEHETSRLKSNRIRRLWRLLDESVE